jgi:PAS domain S-box-containing protein
MGRDGADRRAAEAEARLAALERRYQALGQAHGEMTWSAAPDGTVRELVRHTPGGAHYVDRSAWNDIVHPDDREDALKAWRRAISARGIYESVHRQQWGDGVWRVMRVRAAPVLDDDGNPLEWIGVIQDITERTHNTEQLVIQASMLELTSEAIFMWELGGAITYWNRGAQMLYGYSASEAVGRVTHELLRTLLPMPAEEFEAQLARAGEWAGELTHTTSDGREVTVSSRLQLLREPDGRSYVLETTHDITDRRRLERWSNERARELTAIFEAIPDPVFVYDDQLRIKSRNSAAQELQARVVPQDRLSLSIEERGATANMRNEHGAPLPPEEWPQRRILRGEVLIGPKAMETQIRGLDGQDIQCSVNGVPLSDATGAITGAVVVFHEVTQRRQLERRTQDALDALLAMAQTLILPDDPSADPEHPDDQEHVGAPARREPELQRATGVIAHRLAELTCQVLGCERVALYSLDQASLLFEPLAVAGMGIEEELIWHDVDGRYRILTASDGRRDVLARLRAGESVTLDLSGHLEDPHVNPLRVTDLLLSPLRVGTALVGLLAVDYRGARHRFAQGEIALAEAVAQLAALVIDRARLLRERASAQVEKLALREVNQRLDQFLSIASHELKTPLTTIKSNTQLLVRSLESGRPAGEWTPAEATARETARRRLEGTIQGVNRMVRLVDDLLDTSRIREGTLELHLAPCDLAAVVRTMVREQRQQHSQRTIQLELPAGHTPVSADASRIGQVVSNFLTNALKYSEADRPVHVSLRVERRMARVLVRDEGPGLPPSEHERVWTPFHRAPGVQVLSGSGVGLGLGLHICKMIIDLHGGRHGVISRPGQGATFWFTLPLAATTSPRSTEVPAHGTDGG